MNLQLVLLCSLAYIALLFGVAWWVDRRNQALGRPTVQHPYIYSLSLAVYCTAWTFYGSVGRASMTGLSFLSTYLGPALTAPLWLMVLRKMILISKNQRTTSIADFISARYGKNTSLATVVTLVAVLGIVPYISIQLKAVTFSINILTGNRYAYFQPNAPYWLDAAFWVTVAMALFTVLFGTRKLDPNERHEGLVAAVAFESMVKLIAFFAVGFWVVYRLYDGFGDLFSQASADPEIQRLFSLQSSGVDSMQWFMHLVLAAVAVLLLPRQFHIAVVENTSPRHLSTAVWMFPLYLLLINLFVLPIAFAGKMQFGEAVAPDTFVLSLPLASNVGSIALLAFIGGLSAATSMVIVSTTALSIMIGNHLVVPLLIRLRPQRGVGSSDPSGRLLKVRRVAILLVLVLAYTFLKGVGSGYDLVSVGLISFTAVAQFAPAAFGGMYWKRATQQGAMAGLLVGFAIWFYTLPLTAIADSGFLPRSFEIEGLFGLKILKPDALFGLEGLDPITHAAFWSLLLNILVYAAVSLYTTPSALSLTQADLFVNISRYTAGNDRGELLQREARFEDLRRVLLRFLDENRLQNMLETYSEQNKTWKPGLGTAPDGLIRFAETQLAGAIGSASARLVIDSVAKEHPIALEEIMEVLEQTQEVLRYSKALELKSAELEITTRQLSTANEQLKALDRLKADFITTVTHELRTPVTSIKALSKILLDHHGELSEAKRKDYLGILVSESERIGRLINQVLDLEKIQSEPEGEQGFQYVLLNELVADAVHNLEALYHEKQVACDLMMPDAYVVVYGQRDRLLQVLVNLLSNALTFVPAVEGKVTLHLEAQNGFAVMRVRDNGIGIPAEKQALIFDKFTQLSHRESGKPRGSGLGLFISKTIVEQHGGNISVESKPGEGACFTVVLPLRTDGVTTKAS
ncbi:MAG: histidine kinase [Saprospiraceae bacterium]|nr:histidine kinase [Saprospiraceae bacterium]